MSERVMNQRDYLRNLKVRKQQQLLAQQELENIPQRGERAIQAEENRRQRRAGTRRLLDITRNQQAARCRYCVNDDCPPHSTRRSLSCHAHVISVDEAMKSIIRKSYQLRVRKATLLHSLSIHGRNRKRREKLKKSVVKEVNMVVDWLRNVAIKTQNFIQYYVLQNFSEGQDLSPAIFTP
ncbi:hypothetical protein [Parasitella parasitica]|uniref:Uncharacterized protein n=1 Tax=Parasitella parasitica TaxID=35722 RepID=A0A0B7NN99_9FUNG|nr:hypothetical protein [Parasitella parasitica]